MKSELTPSDLATLTAAQKAVLRTKFPGFAHKFDHYAITDDQPVGVCQRCAESTDFSQDFSREALFGCLKPLTIGDIVDISIDRGWLVQLKNAIPTNGSEVLDALFVALKQRVTG